MNKRIVAFGICALVLLGIGTAPRYLEELRIGGGYGESVDGGADLDKAGNITSNGNVACQDVKAESGVLEAGKDSLVRGVVTAWDGAGGVAPGCLKLASTNGTLSYLFMSNDRSGLRIATSLPASDTDGGWLPSSAFHGSGSTSDAVDLATAEVAGTLPAAKVGAGLTDTQVNNDLTISGGTVNATAIGASTASTGKFTSLQATGDLLVDGADIGLSSDPDLMGLASNHVTVRGNITAQGGQVTGGVNDTTTGQVVLYGDNNVGGSALTLYNAASYDTAVDYWSIFSGILGVFCVGGFGGTANPGIIWAIDPSTLKCTYTYDVDVLGGDLQMGETGGTRGTVTLLSGSASVAPGCLKMSSANGTFTYVFAANDGSGLRIHSALPTSDTDGSWPTSGKFRGSGSTTDAVDLATAEVAGTLPVAKVGSGLTDAQVNNDLTIDGGTINNSSIGASTASTGRFTTLTVTGVATMSSILTFTANDTTPSVNTANIFKVPNTWTAGNYITMFDNGTAGQTLTVIGGDSDCVVVDGTHLKLAGNWTAATDDTLRLVFDGTDWFEIGRTDN